MSRRAIALLALLLAACGGKDEGKTEAKAAAEKDWWADCPPGRITLPEGKTFDIQASLATYDPGTETTTIYLFNHRQTTCDEVRSGMYEIPEGGLSARITDGKSDTIGIESHTQMLVPVKLLKKAENEGDPVEMCVSKTTVEPMMGTFADKQVTFEGKFTGKYCGPAK